MPIPLAGIAAGAQILGGMQANSAARKQAGAQMRFQQEMSNTAYRRAVADMKAAGLNPILAAGSPASSPSGAMAPVRNVAEGLTSSALQKELQTANIDAIEATAAKTRKETEILEDTSEQRELEARFYRTMNNVVESMFGADPVKGLDLSDLPNSAKSVVDSVVSSGVRTFPEGANRVRKGLDFLDRARSGVERNARSLFNWFDRPDKPGYVFKDGKWRKK